MDGDSDVMGIVPVMAMSMTASWNSSRSWSGKLEFNTVESTAQLGFVVGLRKDRYGQNFCGGSLIASSYVLTAAHCVAGNNAKFVSVGSRASAGTETEAIAIRKVRVHPRYGFASKFSYDVAILELDSQAYPQPIVLDNAAGFDASDRFTLYGYGADSADSDELSTVLRSVELPFFPEKRCLKTFPELDSSALCAGGELARDACTGDSGSPLVNWIDNAPYLSGLVSSGRSGCGTPGVPGIYARVSSVTAFIDSYVAGHKWRYEPTEPSFPSSTSETMLVPSMGGPREGVIPRSTSGPPDRASSGSTSIRSRSSTTIVNRDGSTPSSPRPRCPSSAAEPETGEDSLNNWPMSLPSLRSANGNSGAAVSPRADSTGGQPSEVYDGALQALELVDEIPQLVDKSLVKFFMGNYSMFMAWRPPLLDAEAVRLTFYSSGNLTRLLNVITSNSELPLHNRRNRFSIVTTAYDATPRAASDAAHC
ncbi:TPA: hypothetical protein N0F65_003117 [Lagenidium giganteum]|uniref:Peptidase S1 domain-containing protein n=1 Tax=Lagenidium giganteum TaxID=4803 RepID=A0AAV2YUY8_9STRA|nr:TPA: hypothetical protein N0F65_003117 [Lagenidium giganteum]